jgi:hypothetical protein
MNQEIKPEVTQEIAKVNEFVRPFAIYPIENNDNYIKASEIVKQIKDRYNSLETLRLSMTRPLDESKKRIMDLFKPPLELLANTEKRLKTAMGNFQTLQEHIRAEAERKLRERQEQEEAKLKAKIEEAKAKGNEAKVEKLETKLEATETAVIKVEPTIAKVEGVKTRKIWKFKIVELAKVPRQYMIPDEKLLGEIARTTKGMKKIAGIEFYSEDSIAVG